MTLPDSPRRTMSLSQRLRLSLLLLTLVPLVLAGGVALILGRNALSASVASIGQELDHLSQVAAAITGYVQSRELSLRGVAQISALSAMPREQRRELLQRTRDGAEGIVLLGYYGRDSSQDAVSSMALPFKRLESGEQSSLEIRHEVTVESALEGKAMRSRATSPEPGKTLIVLGHPVRPEGSEEIDGALVAWVDLEPALDLLRRDLPGGRMTVWLVEGQQVLATGGAGAEDADLQRLPVPGEGAHLVQSPAGTSILEGSLPVGLPGWHLVWAYPLPEVDEAFRSLAMQVGVFILAAALLAWLLGGLMARRIAAPVEALSASALAISRGDYEAPAPDPGPYREVEELAESFETMRGNLVRTLSDNERLFLYTEGLLRTRVEELQILYNLSEASAVRGDVGTLAGLLLEHIRRLLPNSVVCLWLRDGEGGFVLRALLGMSEGERAALPPPPVSALPGGIAALADHAVVHPPDGEAASHPLVAGRFPGRKVTCYCLVALPVRRDVLGFLEVVPPEGTTLEDASVELLRALGREMGLALENTRLYGRSMAEKRFNEAILEEMGDGVLTLDAQGRLTTFNRAAERITGWNRRDVLGRPVDEVFRLAEAEHPLKRVVQHAGEATPFEAEIPLQGSRKVLLFNPTVPPAVEGAEEAPAAIIVFRDITRIRELEDLRRDFTATISHELRTPLTSIKGYLAALMHPKAKFDEKRVKENLGDISHQVEHLNRLIADLLEAARLRNAVLEVHPRRVELVDLVRERIEEAEKDPGQTIRLEGEGPVWAWCDPDHVAYVMDHLLSNAVKYSLPQGEVVVSARAEPHRVRITVQDFGIGIPPDQQEQIFEMYHRIDTGSTRAHYGIGVGLFIARRIVESHGGSLSVDSKPGVGSTFTVVLPAAEESEESLGR